SALPPIMGKSPEWWPGAESNRHGTSHCLCAFPTWAGRAGYKLGYRCEKTTKVARGAIAICSLVSSTCVKCSLCHSRAVRSREVRIQALFQVSDDLKHVAYSRKRSEDHAAHRFVVSG